MNKTNELKNSISTLTEFMKIKEFKTQDDFLKSLETYCFHEIFENKKYSQFGNGKSYEDGDCTRLAYAIDSIIYFDKMRNYEISVFSENNYGKYKNSFSGDTINTFYTLFGKTDNAQNRVLDILEFDTIQKAIYDKFKKLYQTIGNFYILPKNTINRKSINTYRGTIWNDFFDIFLKELKKTMSPNRSNNDEFSRLYKENEFFFKQLRKIDDFMQLFFLEDDQEGYNYLNDFVLDMKYPLYRHDKLSHKNKDDYKRFAVDYMSKANDLIQKRSRVIVRELRKSLNALNISL